MTEERRGSEQSLGNFLEANDRIRVATEAANVALWSICPSSGETWFSDTWYTLLGYEPGEFLPSFDNFMKKMHPDDHVTTLSAYEDLLSNKARNYNADFRLMAKDGEWRWISASGSKVSRPGNLPYIVFGMQIDISVRKRTELDRIQTVEVAQKHQERLKRLAENSPAALFEFRIDANGTVTLPYVTAGVNEILDVPADDVASDAKSIFQNIFEIDAEEMGLEIERSRTELCPFKFRYRVRRSDKANGFIWVQANSVPHREPDGATSWFGSIYDVTAEVEREAMLAEARDAMQSLALHDGLTGLPNRRRLDAILRERSQTDRLAGLSTIVIRIDLDRFKYVNDTLGHAAGDAVLTHVANLIKASLENGDTPSRMGGDEFCIVLAPGRTLQHATELVSCIQTALTQPMIFEGKPCRFGASFGIASSDHGDIDSGDLMSFADAALYEAKAAGRGRLEVFSSDLHQTILEARHLAAQLETAIERKGFEPYFQPQVCASTGRLVGAEVLCRWPVSDTELIQPGKFLPVAEQIRAVPLIDAIMVEKTYSILKSWIARGFMLRRVSFNVSSGRLTDHSLVDSVRPIQDLGVRVAFELLESILLEEADDAMRFNLDLAREAGIEIEVDDFGSAHSSILGLIATSPDVLKIDRRLIRNVEDTGQSRDVISSIVAIARTQNISVLAEGVETQAQADILSDLGCDVLQGFFYARALTASEFLNWAQRPDQFRGSQAG